MKYINIPEIKPLPCKLIYCCLALILVYLIFAAIYTEVSTDPFAHKITLLMLQSSLISAVIALGGGLLLDCEIRRIENRS